VRGAGLPFAIALAALAHPFSLKLSALDFEHTPKLGNAPLFRDFCDAPALPDKRPVQLVLTLVSELRFDDPLADATREGVGSAAPIATYVERYTEWLQKSCAIKVVPGRGPSSPLRWA